MATNPKADMANFIRYKTGIPLSASDDDVIDFYHETHPQEAQALTKELLGYSSLGAHQATENGMAGQGEFGPVSTTAGKDALSAVGAGLEKANEAVESAPVIGGPLKSLGQAGKGMIDRERQGAEDISKTYPMAGAVAKGLTGLSGLVIPQNGLGVALTTAQAASPALGALSEALEPAEGVVGGSLASGKTAKTAAAAMKAMSGTPEMNVRSALEDPSILSDKYTAADIGDEMNKWGEKMGVKTGAEARGQIPAVKAASSPRLGTGRPFADSMIQNLPSIQKTASVRSARISMLQDRIANSDMIAEDMALQATNDVPEAQTPLAERLKQPQDAQARPATESPLPNGAPDPNLLNRSLAAEQARKQIPAWSAKIKQAAQGEIKQLQAEGSSHLQDLISARSVMSKLRGAPALTNPMEAEDAYLSTQKLNQMDQAISQVADSVQPGSAAEYEGLVDKYHRAKVRESFEPLLAQNQNGSPSVLRAWASGAALMHGNPVPLMAQSPAVQARAIRTAAFLRDLGAQAPSFLSDVGSDAGNVAGPLAGLNNKTQQEGK